MLSLVPADSRPELAPSRTMEVPHHSLEDNLISTLSVQ